MKKAISSMWFRILLCAILIILFIVVPTIIMRTTVSNGLGAGMFVLMLFVGEPAASLFCGIFAAPNARKLWFLPAVPTALYFLLWPYLANTYIPFQLAQFAGLVIGYAAFAVTIDILRKIQNRKQ